ncbi:NAD(P)/FAD-dependent oxidoreductase [Microbacterium sp.]|uniref:NAD(P)/FAD-dependent oxidoreductase n=1 Tax=Microbacterium sp. TaxID=51671 RepID=UPI0039E304D8
MRVVVVGAGIVGLSTAYFLAGDGHEVVLLDRAEPGAGASSHNAGWLAPSMAVPVTAPGALGQAMRWMLRHDTPLYVRPRWDLRYAAFLLRLLASCRAAPYAAGVRALAPLAQGALDAYDQLRDEGLAVELSDRPLTMLFTDPAQLDAHVREVRELERSGAAIAWSVDDAEELRQRIPGVSQSVVGALDTWGDRVVDPAVLVRELTQACRRRGVEVVCGVDAAFESTRSRPRLRHRDGVIAGDAYVVSAGVWSDRVVRPLGQRLSLAAGKGYGFDLPVVPELAGGPLYLAEGRVAMTPYPDRLRLSGTMGFGAADHRIDRRRAAGILASADRYLPGFGLAAAAGEPWTGLRPMTPDGVPIIGRLPATRSVVVATGHQMMGVTLGPVTGRLVAGLIASDRDEIDPAYRVR